MFHVMKPFFCHYFASQSVTMKNVVFSILIIFNAYRIYAGGNVLAYFAPP
jgi:hypothetical protein